MPKFHILNDPSGRIIVSSPYDPLLVEKVKSVDGRRWHPSEEKGAATSTLNQVITFLYRGLAENEKGFGV